MHYSSCYPPAAIIVTPGRGHVCAHPSVRILFECMTQHVSRTMVLSLSVRRSVTTLQRHYFYVMHPVPHRLPKLNNGISVDELLEDVDVDYPCGDAQFLLFRLSICQLVLFSTSGMEKLPAVYYLYRARRR